jgi:hypothetical protein
MFFVRRRDFLLPQDQNFASVEIGNTKKAHSGRQALNEMV